MTMYKKTVYLNAVYRRRGWTVECPAMPKSVFTDAYATAISLLVSLRKESSVSQVELARRLGKPQQFVSSFERLERRLDVVEFYAVIRALGADAENVFQDLVQKLPPKVEI